MSIVAEYNLLERTNMQIQSVDNQGGKEKASNLTIILIVTNKLGKCPKQLSNTNQDLTEFTNITSDSFGITHRIHIYINLLLQTLPHMLSTCFLQLSIERWI